MILFWGCEREENGTAASAGRKKGCVDMIRVNKILAHPLFTENLDKNMAAEADRRFCHHDLAHFLDVARIGYLIDLEEGQGISKELIYGAALLHDLGKHRQYGEGIPHERTGASMAPGILLDCGFSQEEAKAVAAAILRHRDPQAAQELGLTGILYRADKASRPCFGCAAEAECNWKQRKKNGHILY